jgi:hypothetical protein
MRVAIGHGRQLLRGDEPIEGHLAGEVGVDAFLAGLGGLGDPVDPRPGDPMLGESKLNCLI